MLQISVTIYQDNQLINKPPLMVPTTKPELLATNSSQNMLLKSNLTPHPKNNVYKLLPILKVSKLMLKLNQLLLKMNQLPQSTDQKLDKELEMLNTLPGLLLTNNISTVLLPVKMLLTLSHPCKEVLFSSNYKEELNPQLPDSKP